MTTEELTVLDRGLKHAPVKNLNKFDTYIGIRKYVRKLNMKKYFLNHTPYQKSPTTSSPHLIHSTLRNNFTFNPQESDNQHIEVFKELLLEDLESLEVKKKYDPIPIKK